MKLNGVQADEDKIANGVLCSALDRDMGKFG